ncbi:unnamed protein product [Diamesa serratosioi]
MVRVMSIYHFASQNIQQLAIEDLVSGCLIPPNEIVLAKRSDHSIEIRKLNTEQDAEAGPSKMFSSVDDVDQIIYSKRGNFICTLESRMSNYEKAEIKYVRIYVNWDKPSSGSSLRARIAGKITPMKKSLEMIELPLNYNPSVIACCEATGNLLVAHLGILQLFEFRWCTNETTKLQYVDFFEVPFQIELDFHPQKLLINENVIACSNKQFFCCFKVIESCDGNNSTSESTNVCTSMELPPSKIYTLNLDEEPLDFAAVRDRTDINGVKFNVQMKSTDQETSNTAHSGDEMEMRPAVIQDINVILKYINNLPETFSLPSKYATQNILQLKLQPLKISGVLRENNDNFKCLHMQPLYLKSDKNYETAKEKHFFLHSKFHRNFYGCAILITTHQDGYLYQIKTDVIDPHNCFLNIYPFTSSVIDVYFNDNVLHALTDNGIESYTVRIGQKLFNESGTKEGIYRNLSKSISLINLRPFLHVHFMIASADNLILMANETQPGQEDAIWTFYNLKYPDMASIYQDFKEFADKSLRKYPTVYLNLLEEIHLMIRTHLALAKIVPAEDSDVEMKLVGLAAGNVNDEVDLLKDSSLSLADCYILSNNRCDYQQSLVFYELAKVNIVGIFQRFLDQNGLKGPTPVGLIENLKSCFSNLTIIGDSRKFDNIFASTIQFPDIEKPLKFGDALIELFKKFAPKEVALLALESTIFREYMDERIFEFLSNFPDKSNEEMLSIILHLLKKDEVMGADALLSQISREDLYVLLSRHWNILFEFSSYSTMTPGKKSNKTISSFSDFTELLFLTNPQQDRSDQLTEVIMYHMYETKSLKFHAILKLFMEYLASQLGSDSYMSGQNILKMLLEKYLQRFYEIKSHNDADLSLLSTTSSANTTTTISASSAVSSQLLTSQSNGTQILFIDERYRYLDWFPPFENLMQILNTDDENCYDYNSLDKDLLMTLIKLQALLCSGEVSSDIAKELLQYTESNPQIIGHDSILVCLIPLHQAIEVIIRTNPQCILEYGRCHFKLDSDWTFLIKALQKKVNELEASEDNIPCILFYHRLMKETLEFLASCKPLEQLLKIFPEEKYLICTELYEKCASKNANQFDEYLRLCVDKERSEKIKKMISNTGYQLWDAINKN